jgi:Domain of unknown function (DUF4416)
LGKTRKYNPVKLIIGFIYKDEVVFTKTKDKLRRKFGKIDFQSPALDFNYTDYYEPEMGSGLKRRFISFRMLVRMQDLYRIKLYTNRLESHGLASDCQSHRLENRGRKALVCPPIGKANGRLINIDPGYVDMAKLVLASTKDYAHRIYLRKGIFAEITLSYRGNSFSPNDWTYPDYRSAEYINIFNQIRELYAS